MSEWQPSIGAQLRAAREAQGYTVQEAANHLRLMNRQIEAMEADDFSSLGQPVFARGFVRNYARLLGLDHVEIVRAMGGDAVEPVEVAETAPLLEPGSWLSSRWIVAGVIGLLLLIAVPVALYVWLNSEEDETHPPPAAAVSQPAARAPERVATLVAPQNPVVPSTAEVVTEPAVTAPAVAAPQADSTQADPTSADSTQADSTQADLTSTRSAPPAAAAPRDAVPPRGELHFEFNDDAWVEIRDGTGRMLHRQMDRKGSSIDISGQPPFNLVVGNAAQVRMTYNGRPLDLKPFIEVKVARFNLEE